MLKIKFSHFYHPVHDIKEAIRFFKDIIGLEMKFHHLTEATEADLNSEDINKINWLEFCSDDITLLVQHVPNIVPYETGVGFTVDNCDEAFVYFRNMGVEISRPIEGIMGNLRTFEIKDPTGSTFTIFGK